MTTQVKICGLTRREDVETAVDAGANFLGFIVEAKSKRRVSSEVAAKLIKNIRVNTVAVTVDPNDDLVERIRAAGLTHIQLHGSETLQRTAEIARTGLSVIKAVKVSTCDEVKLATEYSGAADFVLFDAKPPKSSEQQGGHGVAFDWSILHGAATPKLWALAGGLTPKTVGKAIAETRAPIVDVASGVESAAGVKDAALIRAFMETVRG